MKPFVTVVAVAGMVFCGITAFAQDRCDAILRLGIFDEKNVLDLHTTYKLVKKDACSSDVGVSIKSLSVSKSDFCNASVEQVMTTNKYVESIRSASTAIVTAWRDCITKKRQGLRHYFTTSSDPRRFSYTLIYDSIGSPRRSRIEYWNMTPTTVKCKGKKPGKDKKYVDDTSIVLDCERKLVDTVSVSVTARSGQADSIELPAVRDAYVFVHSPADDVSTCYLNETGAAETGFSDTQLKGPERKYYLNPIIETANKWTIRCKITDLHPGSDFRQCWGGHFALFKNGHPLWERTPYCCNADICNTGRLAWDEHFDLDLSKEAVSLPPESR